MLTRKILLTLSFSIVLFLSSLAQNITIKGRVTSEETGEPVSGASVRVKGNTKVGVSTDAQGEFILSVPLSAKILLISGVDYNLKEVTIGKQATFQIELTSTNQTLDDVVVVGYGTAKKLSSVVGSFSRVDAKQIEKRPTANVLDALQGKVAGLAVYTGSGEPTATPSFNLRGVGSLSGSTTPFIVMDGTPIDLGTLLSLNPQDIESVTVLKDASATSIYGSQAANGVMYITTKKGREGMTNISIGTQYGISNLANTAFYEQLMNTKQFADFTVDAGIQSRADVDVLLARFPNDTRWYKTYFKENTPTFQINASASGGAEGISYYFSGGYFHQEGLAYRSGYDRYNLRSNISADITDWLKAGINLGLSYDKRNSNAYFGTNSTNGGLAFLAAPYFSPINPETGNKYPDLIPGWNRYNPEYLANNILSPSNNAQFNPTVFLELTPYKGLTMRSQAGMDAYDLRSNPVRLPSYLGSLNNGSVSETFRREVQRTITNTIEYKFNLNNLHDFIILGGQEYRDNTNTSFSGSSNGQTDDRLILLQNGPTTITVNSNKNEYSFYSYFSRLEYTFSQKYSASLSLRQDESSLFGINVRKGTFYSVGVKWYVKSEDFLKDVSWLDNLSISLNTGTSGNAGVLGNYQSLALAGTSQYDSQPGFVVSAPGNPNLTWEKQSTSNLGITFDAFKRLHLQLDLYNRNTLSQLIDVPYPYTSGFSEITSNVGSLNNKGIDIELNFDVFDRSKKYFITPYINLNYNKQKITDLFQGKQYWIIPNTGVSWAVGQPVSYFYPIFAGVNSETGAPQWYLPNGDPNQVVNTRNDNGSVTGDFSKAALQQNTGIRRTPPMVGGFGLASGYQGFTLNADFSFALGKYLINNDRYFFENPTVFVGFNQSQTVLDYWKQPGDRTRFPSLDYQFTQFDSRLIENASFMRLKNLTLGYALPKSLLRKSRVLKNVKIYLTGRNLITVTKYTGSDPEIDSNLTLGANPNTKQYVAGLDISF